MVGIDSLPGLDVSKAPSLPKDFLQKFEKLFRENFEEEKKFGAYFGGRERFVYPASRAIRTTINSEELNEKNLTNVEIKELADFILKSPRYTYGFKELISRYQNDINFNDLPRNARRIYAAGKSKLRSQLTKSK